MVLLMLFLASNITYAEKEVLERISGIVEVWDSEDCGNETDTGRLTPDGSKIYEKTCETRHRKIDKEYGQVIRARCKDGSCGWYIRLQYDDGTSYKWNAPLREYNDKVLDTDARWVRE